MKLAWRLAGLVSLPMLVSACGGLSWPTAREVPADPVDNTPFDRWQQKSVHNAYDQGETVSQQLEEHRFRSVEFDVHNGKRGRAPLAGDWYVYHADFPGFDGSSCRTLTECLGQVTSWHRTHPDHEVLTLFVDLKDSFEAGHTPDLLDQKLTRGLDDGAAMLKPRSVLARCPGATTLREAVTGGCGWPTMGELRGKIIVALTGGDVCERGSKLGAYAGSNDVAANRAAFIAPNVRSSCPFSVHGQKAPQAILFNLDHNNLGQATSIAQAGLVSRAYYGGLTGGLDDAQAWADARTAGAQFLATDRIDARRYPWVDRLRPRPVRRLDRGDHVADETAHGAHIDARRESLVVELLDQIFEAEEGPGQPREEQLTDEALGDLGAGPRRQAEGRPEVARQARHHLGEHHVVMPGHALGEA